MMKLRLPLLLLLTVSALPGCLPATRTVTMTGASLEESHATLQRSKHDRSLGYNRRTILDEAERWLGVPYRYGGTTTSGVDCSGFVCNVFAAININLPRTSSQQSSTGISIGLDRALPGDLVFFNTSGRGVSHVGILITREDFVHASTSSGVIVSSLSDPYYRDRLVGIRRVVQ